MSEVIYSTVIKTEGRKKEKMEMTVDIYESVDSVKDPDLSTNTNTHQPQPQTGSGHSSNRSYNLVSVCLLVLCVLLLTALTVLCVLINTNYQHCRYNNANITEERDELRDKYNNITQQYEQLNESNHELLKFLHDGWIYYQSSLYFMSSESKTWSESRRYCKDRGGDLIIIDNKEEHEFFKTKSSSENFWIGLSYRDVEGKWKWVDGSTITYSTWSFRQPNGGTHENCVVSYSSWWYAYSCKNT